MGKLFKNRWELVFFGFASLLAISFIAMAAKGYPLAETDSQWFLPPAISLRHGDGLYNRIHIQSHRYDIKNDQRFVWYTQGFPITLATFMWKASARCAFIILAAMNAGSLMLTAWLLRWMFTRSGKVFGQRECVWSILGLLAAATYLVNGRIGRPDYLATLLVMGMTFETLQYRIGWRRELLNAILLAWIGFSHPVAALFASTIMGMAYAILPIDKGLFRLSVVGVLSLTFFVVFMYFFGIFGLKDNIESILYHAKITMLQEVVSPDFLKFWIIHTYATGYGILFMGAIASVVVWLRHHPLPIARKVVAFVFIGLFLYLTNRFVAISWDRTYNLWVFTPIFVALFLLPIADRWFDRGAQKLFKPITAFLLVGFSIGYFHTLLIFPYYLGSDSTYDRAQAQIREFFATHQGRVGVSKSLWPLVDAKEYNRTFTVRGSHVNEMAECAKIDWVILQERYYFYKQPPEVAGHVLLENHFSSRPLRILGVQMIPTSPGYQWAVYGRKDHL